LCHKRKELLSEVNFESHSGDGNHKKDHSFKTGQDPSSPHKEKNEQDRGAQQKHRNNIIRKAQHTAAGFYGKRGYDGAYADNPEGVKNIRADNVPHRQRKFSFDSRHHRGRYFWEARSGSDDRRANGPFGKTKGLGDKHG